jgi:hypothetical protein
LLVGRRGAHVTAGRRGLGETVALPGNRAVLHLTSDALERHGSRIPSPNRAS